MRSRLSLPGLVPSATGSRVLRGTDPCRPPRPGPLALTSERAHPATPHVTKGTRNPWDSHLSTQLWDFAGHPSQAPWNLRPNPNLCFLQGGRRPFSWAGEEGEGEHRPSLHPALVILVKDVILSDFRFPCGAKYNRCSSSQTPRTWLCWGMVGPQGVFPIPILRRPSPKGRFNRSWS